MPMTAGSGTARGRRGASIATALGSAATAVKLLEGDHVAVGIHRTSVPQCVSSSAFTMSPPPRIAPLLSMSDVGAAGGASRLR
jgi:hypothetical protein